MTKKRILIVEDDEGIATLERARLERCGHDVIVARTAEETLALLDESEQVDLFLLDYRLPGDVSGLALLLILKERGFTSPAILVTGFEDPNIVIQAMRAGVRDFLPKTPDYLDDLPITVERVLKQAHLEQQAAASAMILDKQELLEAAFDAARLAAFVWDLQTGSMRCTGHFDDLLGESRVSHLKSFESLLSFVNASDQVFFQKSIDSARETRGSIEHQFRIYRDDGELRWVFAKGRFHYDRNGTPIRLTCVLHDISSRKRAELELLQSHEKIKALNGRLQMGMVETNHRVKNHLQKLISLVNFQMRSKQGALSQDDVQNIVGHIQALAALHDVLAGEVSAEGDGLSVDAAEVLHRVVAALGRVLEDRQVETELSACRVSSRQAASLSVILNELLANALKHGTGDIKICLTCDAERGVLSVENSGSAFPEMREIETSSRTGLKLVRMLAKSDFDCQPNFENTPNGFARAELQFPLDPDSSLH